MTERGLRAATAAALALATLATVAHARDTGMAFVSSEKDNALAIIDLTTLTIAGTIQPCKHLIVQLPSENYKVVDLKPKTYVL